MKTYFKIFAFIALFTGFISCDKDDELIVFDDINGQTLAQLSVSSATMPTPADGVTTFDIEVLVTTKSTSDRTISVEVVSQTDPDKTSATPDQYSISDLIIPAGSYSGKIKVTSNYDAIPEDGSTYLTINITGIEGTNAVIENGSITLELFRKCPIVLADFVGTWSGEASWYAYFGYPTQIVTFLNNDGELMMNGIAFGWFTGWWGEVIVTNEAVRVDIDMETGEFVIPEQFYITSTWNGSPQPSYNMKATGVITNACQRTLTINPVFVQNGGDIDGTAWGIPFVENIQLN